jgi:hypothetical protein
MDFDFYSASYNTSGPLAPSSHEMRYKPFLESMNPQTQKMRKRRGRGVKVVSMSRNAMMTLQGDPPMETLFPRVTHLLGNHVNHQGEIRKKV